MRSTIAMALCALHCCGCVRTVTTAPYQPAKRNSGVVYALPKTRLKVTVTYTIRTTTKVENGVARRPSKDVVISKPVAIESYLVGDTNNMFVLSGEKLVSDSRLDASFKFQLNDNQTLASVATEAVDKSPEILQGLVGSGISIAKMVAVAGDGQLPSPLKEIAARIDAINGELAAQIAGSDSTKLDKIDKLLKEQAVLLEAAKRYIDANSEKVDEKEIAYTEILDLEDFVRAGNSFEKMVAAPGAKLGDFSNPAVPQLKIQLVMTDEQMQLARSRFFASLDDKPEPTVVYRVPTRVRVKATYVAKGILLFDEDVAFAQVGPFNSVEARYKKWGKRKTQITFNSTTGSLKDYGIESTSSAEAAAKALDTSLGKVQTVVGDLKKAEAAANAAEKSPEEQRLANLQIQTKLAEAEAALLKAQKALNDLKN